MFASSYPLADVFVSTLDFALFIVWIIIIFHVVVDIMRSHDLSGTAKAAWVLFILILPLIGSLVYLVVRGWLNARAPTARRGGPAESLRGLHPPGCELQRVRLREPPAPRRRPFAPGAPRSR